MSELKGGESDTTEAEIVEAYRNRVREPLERTQGESTVLSVRMSREFLGRLTDEAHRCHKPVGRLVREMLEEQLDAQEANSNASVVLLLQTISPIVSVEFRDLTVNLSNVLTAIQTNENFSSWLNQGRRRIAMREGVRDGEDMRLLA
ncbi:MAG: hypothetical protein M0Z29_11290 [Actinomycetota bacterium]|nr:hypothetical protein [Actinomycetota bacterium]